MCVTVCDCHVMSGDAPLQFQVSLSDSSPDISAAAETVLEILPSLSDQLQVSNHPL